MIVLFEIVIMIITEYKIINYLGPQGRSRIRSPEDSIQDNHSTLGVEVVEGVRRRVVAEDHTIGQKYL